MKTFKFGKKTYAIDLNKAIEWITLTDDNKQVQSSVTEVWSQTENNENDLSLMSKEFSDVKSDSALSTIKYDIINNFINVILDIGYTPEGNIKTELDFTISESISFNTLIMMGIIFEVE